MKYLVATLLLLTGTPAAADDTPADLVDPFVGTLADFGQLSPAAVAPFGMVQLGPDTDPANHAGYDHAATRLRGFSHTRGVGVGCSGGGGDLLVSLRRTGATGNALIDKRSETARAGRYGVRYDDGILAEATATRGAGLLRFTVARAGDMTLRIDLRHQYAQRLSSAWHTDRSDDLRVELVAGTVCDKGRYRLFTSSRITLNGRPLHRMMTRDGDIATLAVPMQAGDAIEVRTGLSTVDATGATLVRDRELSTRPFAAVAARTRTAWNDVLGGVTIDGDMRDRALFYSSLFRVFQTPVAIDDPDSRHRENDGRVARSARGQTRYASWSLWDNYRTQLPLLALLQPRRSADIARSLADLYIRGKPQWATLTEPFLTVRTEHAGIALLDLRRKGITGFDAKAALAGMVKDSTTLQRDTPDQQIEAAYDDWATAALATDLGDTDIATNFSRKAHDYRSMWRSTFQTPGPDADIVKARGLYQGTLWQYRWAPVFDLDWLVRTVGPASFGDELHHFFDAGLFNMTNEPDIHVPWLFAIVGQPQRTADLVRKIMTRPIAHPYTNSGKLATPFVGPSFALSPQGFADGMDDDAGAMTAWYVFAALGLYPLVPGEPWYIVTIPAIANARIDLGDGRAVSIRRVGPYDGMIVRADWNGRPLTDWRIDHATLSRGGTLTVTTRAR
ncbi:glycoside hydrolase domain-containing protein [Sphingomonas mollis]|uniref:Glycoside hydrolase family 92 protein n=1 Tax=Sphingomonas mollis TaxID=2795726 RepID=A0ABS0XK18_9SPHN|nr:glycoside hydrolase domain-containing protein [Sphingomonas sp. BT553]MBJ6120383.1 glycoside hydrolase family 92 protein [Sphingomonas sp. BT553]